MSQPDGKAALEAPLDPRRPIIDPHLHHWHIQAQPGALQEPQRFLLDEARSAIEQSGHAITHTIFVECHAMYRAEGDEALRSLGETEFANGIAAMAASSAYGPCRFADRIVGHVDLMPGDAAGPVLDRHMAAAGQRFAGVRNTTSWSGGGLFGGPCDPLARERLRDPRFRAGAQAVARRGLVLDVWCLHSQLADLAALADAVPDLVIVLDHVGTPERGGRWAGDDPEVFAEWRAGIAALAQRPNLRVKIGGMGMRIDGPISNRTGTASSEHLAAAWEPFALTCIEAFGPQRSMFESNYPPDRAAGGYGTIWNAFKRITAAFSDDEKEWLFRKSAAETYRVGLAASA